MRIHGKNPESHKFWEHLGIKKPGNYLILESRKFFENLGDKNYKYRGFESRDKKTQITGIKFPRLENPQSLKQNNPES